MKISLILLSILISTKLYSINIEIDNTNKIEENIKKEKKENRIISNIESIDLGIKSFHPNKNEINKAVNFRYENENTGKKEKTKWEVNEKNLGFIINFKNNLSLGYIHKNSFYNKSYIFGYNFDLGKTEFVDYKLKTYIISGYDKPVKVTYYNGKEVKIKERKPKYKYKVLPSISFDINMEYIKFTIIPNPMKLKSSVIYTGINIPF